MRSCLDLCTLISEAEYFPATCRSKFWSLDMQTNNPGKNTSQKLPPPLYGIPRGFRTNKAQKVGLIPGVWFLLVEYQSYSTSYLVILGVRRCDGIMNAVLPSKVWSHCSSITHSLLFHYPTPTPKPQPPNQILMGNLDMNGVYTYCQRRPVPAPV